MALDLQQFQQQVLDESASLNAMLDDSAISSMDRLAEIITEINEEIWEETNCLSCANCCKTRTPFYSDEDVNRISHHMGITEDNFRRTYLLQYTNGKWVNLQQPCPFLGSDNRCAIYDVRPANCADFPHHNERPFISRKESHIRNMHTCPATFKLLQRLRAAFVYPE